RIVEGITKEYESAATMMAPPHETHTGKSEPVTKTGTVVRAGAIVRISRVIDVNPRLSGTATHVTHNLAFGRTPSQTYNIYRHTPVHFPIAYQSLVLRRSDLVDLWIL